MIDKIEALQGGGPVRETRLSLMPEGLGKVDISIRQDDAGLHVQFNTDTQAARQLIADAQPKLAEIAQERGIRLGSTSVESNATGTGAGTANPQMNQGQRNDAQPQRNQPSPPPSARREAQSSTNSDERGRLRFPEIDDVRYQDRWRRGAEKEKEQAAAARRRPRAAARRRRRRHLLRHAGRLVQRRRACRGE
jgi:hypothetical protein